MQPLPATGLPMWQAMHALYEGSERDLLAMFTMLEPQLNGAALAGQLRANWSGILRRSLHGEVRITGISPGGTAEEDIPRALLKQSLPNFQADTLATSLGTYTGVMVLPAGVAPMTTSAPINPRSQKPSQPLRLDYTEADAPLHTEMYRLIKAGEATGPNDAARLVADRASGRGTSESKRKRLLRGFNKGHRADE